jgi:uncharacterized membrane protein
MPFDLTPAMAIDLAALVVTLTALVGYHLFLRHKVRNNKNFTFQATMTKSRAAWVRAVMAEGKDVLAVQTLRNSTMAATFMASTAVLLIIGVLTLSAQGERLEASWHVLNPMGPSGAVLWTVKTLVLLVDLFAAFLSFTMAIRQFHHVGYMINVPMSGKYGRIPLDTVIAQLERSGRFYWLGMRTYFLLVPLVLWLFGPYVMLAATTVLIAVLYRLDHMPLDEERTVEAADDAAPRFGIAAE